MLDDPASTTILPFFFAMRKISMERGGKMTYVCPQVKTQTMTEEDARELHWNSAMRRRYYQHG
jgi:hypothetical protein